MAAQITWRAPVAKVDLSFVAQLQLLIKTRSYEVWELVFIPGLHYSPSDGTFAHPSRHAGDFLSHNHLRQVTLCAVYEYFPTSSLIDFSGIVAMLVSALFTSLALLVISGGVSALPTASTVFARDGVTTLSTTQLSAFAPFTQFARAAYCDPSKIEGWNCGGACDALPGFQPTLTGGDGNVIQFFFVGYWPSGDTIVVAHQGTDPAQLESDLTDIIIVQGALDPELFPGVPSGVEVHLGFANEHAMTAKQILAEVQSLMNEHGTNSVTLVGHSLGGALSELECLFMKLNLPSGTAIKGVTYGTPRVGNPAFASYFDEQVPDFTRINNMKDLIPIVPGRFLGFSHPHGEVHILQPGTAVSCPGDDDATDAQCQIMTVPTVFDGNIIDHLVFHTRLWSHNSLAMPRRSASPDSAANGRASGSRYRKRDDEYERDGSLRSKERDRPYGDRDRRKDRDVRGGRYEDRKGGERYREGRRRDDDERDYARGRGDREQPRERRDRDREGQRSDRGGPSSRRPASPRARSRPRSNSRSAPPEDADKGKPNFKPSGLLAAATNLVRKADGSSALLKYNEPPRGEEAGGWVEVVRVQGDPADQFAKTQSVMFNRRMNSVSQKGSSSAFVRVVSCSALTALFRPFIIDLESTNGTLVNDETIPTTRFYELKAGDVLKFGQSTREYVLLHDEAT
ncbi:hypothetical protein EW146_g6281 [Bondarzewia mesenterica]|uniref:FHA domain-containing protein n=1 Tax=Bondarzewia mesenterica TaxID=1095465 RepID=A0A4S4LP19_9AGAM|nr:hypothetical protein EW146_g6281 [Bondarzewia mesenterica]